LILSYVPVERVTLYAR